MSDPWREWSWEEDARDVTLWMCRTDLAALHQNKPEQEPIVSDLTASDLVVNSSNGEKTSSDMVIIFRAAQLGGDFSIMTGEVRPKELLAPHTHTHEDQAVYILTGELEFEVGGEGGLRFSAGAGDFVLKPRNIQHGFWNTGEETVHYIELSGRDGFEQFVDSRSEGVTAMVAGGEEVGLTNHIDRIPGLMCEHRLTGLSGVNLPPFSELMKSDEFREAMKDLETRSWIMKMAAVQVRNRLPSLGS